jgi:hypothetical protein
MTKKQIDKLTRKLDAMRLPDLQAEFQRVTGTANRSPNRKFLIRGIVAASQAGGVGEATPAAEGSAAAGEPAPSAAPAATDGQDEPEEEVEVEIEEEDAAQARVEEEGAAAERAEEAAAEEEGDAQGEEEGDGDDEAVAGGAAGAAPSTADEVPLSKMSVAQLRRLYVQVVGRNTGSTDKAYLIWKIREARKGRIRVGPAPERTPHAGNDAFMVLPLRVPRLTVAKLDAAWQRAGIESRTAFLFRATRMLLKKLGEDDVAELFKEPAKAERGAAEAAPARRRPARRPAAEGRAQPRGGRAGRPAGRRQAGARAR